jgi:hypothetical protein
MATLEDARAVARTLPRSTEAFVHGRVKFRIGRIVYLAFSRDEATMGFAFPKEWREALVQTEPNKFLMPPASDLRYNWAEVRLAAIDAEELRDLVVDAWALVVPKSVAEAYAESIGLHSPFEMQPGENKLRTGEARSAVIDRSPLDNINFTN